MRWNFFFLIHELFIAPSSFTSSPEKKLRAKLTRKFDTSCNMQDCTTFEAQKFLLLSCRKTALLSKQSLWYLLTSLMLQLFFTQSLLLLTIFSFSFKRGNFFSKNLFALETRKYLEMPFPLVNNFAKVPKDSFLSAEFQIGRYFYRVLHLKIVTTKRTF